MSLTTRLAKLEAAAPGNKPLQCWLWVDANASEENMEAQKAKRIAELRAANDWPDDGQHPVEVTMFSWLRAGSDA
jgi:hypothetical protein